MSPDAQPEDTERVELGEIDDLDRAIIARLQQDGRETYRAIGRALEVPEATVRFRVNRLQQAGLIRITVFAHPERLGFGMLASLLVRVAAPRRASVISELEDWDEVMYLSSCAGRSDLLVQVIGRSLGELEDVLSVKIAALDGVEDVELLVELKIHKAHYHTPRQRTY